MEGRIFPDSMEYTVGVGIAKSIIEGSPGIDAVNVVRCGNCVNFGSYRAVDGVVIGICRGDGKCKSANDFCSSGRDRNDFFNRLKEVMHEIENTENDWK